VCGDNLEQCSRIGYGSAWVCGIAAGVAQDPDGPLGDFLKSMNAKITADEGPRSEGAASAHPLDKSNQRVRAMFGQIAGRYDLMNHLLSLNIDRRWRRQTVERLRLDRQEPVLDVCTGTGDLALEISRRVGPSVSVIGSDFCHPMLDVATGKAARAESKSVRFVEADAQRLPFADNTFQCVTVAFGLRNIADTDRGIDEMLRVCVAGGQVAVLEFSRSNTLGLKQAYEFYFKYLLPMVGQRLAKNDKSAYHYLPQSVAQFPCGEALVERMKQRGLRNVRMYPMTFSVATLYVGDK
jgi:demethylmenaquinone methyltransferase/2-methoxy-6-polyprenyl-1,4-benzoquinol methylase